MPASAPPDGSRPRAPRRPGCRVVQAAGPPLPARPFQPRPGGSDVHTTAGAPPASRTPARPRATPTRHPGRPGSRGAHRFSGTVSVDLQGIGPGREAGHDIELAKQSGHHFVGVGFARKLFEVGHHALQGTLDATNRLLGEVLSLLLEAFVMLQEFFAIELSERRYGQGRVAVGEETREAI